MITSYKIKKGIKMKKYCIYVSREITIPQEGRMYIKAESEEEALHKLKVLDLEENIWEHPDFQEDNTFLGGGDPGGISINGIEEVKEKKENA